MGVKAPVSEFNESLNKLSTEEDCEMFPKKRKKKANTWTLG